MPYLWIGAASLLAHIWCLGSQFYLDDMPHIRDSEVVRNGEVFSYFTVAWTSLCYHGIYRVFGMSEPVFHAVNWLVHTASACMLFVVGRGLLGDAGRWRIAWFAALLFAVHPLCSEIPNYARCQDLAWVTLFSLVASWGGMGFLGGGNRWALLVCAAGMAGAAMSKGPGVIHAAMAVGVVGLISLQAGQVTRRRVAWVGAVFLTGVAVLWLCGVLPEWAGVAKSTWATPRFIGHAYTIARVFWEFAWRAVVPVHLSADHQIAETMIPPGGGWGDVDDGVAVVAAVGMLALVGLALFLMWKPGSRLFGGCLLLFVGTMLFRVMYVMPEFMPEYRIYPGMPWFCLGAAVLLDGVWRRFAGGRSPRWIAAGLLVTGALLSANRSFVWHERDRLCMDVLRQYPAQARALWMMHDRDVDEGNWQALIDRHEAMWPVIFEHFIGQMKELQPGRDLNSGHFALADVACHGRLAIARAHVNGPAAGVMEIRRLEARMRQLGITEETNGAIWAHFHYTRAVVMEYAGAYPQALESMRFAGVYRITERDIRRVEAKLAERRQ
jgi:4-amino-4-deoxy-L-arabinose transferase-like glycosyltransferase